MGELVPDPTDVSRLPVDPKGPAVARRDIRVSDKDRHAVVDELRVHFGEGRLDLAEFEERTNAALVAVTRGELEPLLDDLPYLHTHPASSGPPVRERPPRNAGPVALRVHTYIWLVLSVFWVVIWLGVGLTGGGAQGFWPIFPIAGVGLTVGIHAAVRKGIEAS